MEIWLQPLLDSCRFYAYAEEVPSKIHNYRCNAWTTRLCKFNYKPQTHLANRINCKSQQSTFSFSGQMKFCHLSAAARANVRWKVRENRQACFPRSITANFMTVFANMFPADLWFAKAAFILLSLCWAATTISRRQQCLFSQVPLSFLAPEKQQVLQSFFMNLWEWNWTSTWRNIGSIPK